MKQLSLRTGERLIVQNPARAVPGFVTEKVSSVTQDTSSMTEKVSSMTEDISSVTDLIKNKGFSMVGMPRCGVPVRQDGKNLIGTQIAFFNPLLF